MGDKRVLKQRTEGQLIMNFISNTDKTAAARQTPGVIQDRLFLLDKYWNKILNRHLELDPTGEYLKDDPYFSADLFSQIEGSYIIAKAELQQRLTTLAPPAAPSAAMNHRPVVDGSAAIFRLPKLVLPHFSGRQLEWDTFKERFCSLVKDQPSISPVLKLQYLLPCLEGPAAKRLANMEVTNANFAVAWSSLCKRYDNSRVRQSARISRLLSLAPAAHKSAAELTRLLDEVEEGVRAPKFIGRPVERWDNWFVEILSSKLDPSTKEDWEKSLEGAEGFPSYQQMVDFLENRARSLETARPNLSSTPKLQPSKKPNKPSKSVSSFHSSSTADSPSTKSSQPRGGCSMCQGSHFLGYCPTFTKMDDKKRLYPSLPPIEKVQQDPAASILSSASKVSFHTTQVSDQALTSSPTPCARARTTLLATAWVVLESFDRVSTSVRALIDPASEGSFITEKVAQALSLQKRKSLVSVIGVGGSTNITSKFSTEVILRSKIYSNFNLSFSALILGNLTSVLPRERCNKGSWQHIQGLELADPTFFEPSSIDCILGADIHPELMRSGLRKGDSDQPMAQETVFGWILTGPSACETHPEPVKLLHSFHTTTSSTSEIIRRFWEIEEVSTKPVPSAQDLACEEHFKETHRRDPTGRYVLRLPFCSTPDLGHSLRAAHTRFLQVERRMQAKPTFKQAYVSFMQEILDLRHMEAVPGNDVDKNGYYMPHHAVLKQDGSGKVRVVFNASQPSSNGSSLNDHLHVGPKLQADIIDILTRWRFFRIAFTADVIKMFRQFEIDERDRDWLRIVWRNSPHEALKDFRIRTVVYGTACAPYQANRAILQLAQGEQSAFPRAAEILRANIYVDDTLAGADTVEDALLARDELIAILRTAGIELGKWSATHSALLEALPNASNEPRSFNLDDVISTLELQWIPASDCFCYRVTACKKVEQITKRAMLSEIARLFDPLGWLAPIVIIGKILIQQLWIEGTDWDQPAPTEIITPWNTLRDQLPSLEALRIPRWLSTRSCSRWYLHGFADASIYAYAAVVYLVTEDAQERPRSTLLMAKSKIAPIKTISIPRLELCGVLLLARLMSRVLSTLQSSPAGAFCWSDSQVTLALLSNQLSKWTTFVANRVSEMLTALPGASWSYVRTAENPVDLASRGVMPEKLARHSLWWHGPPWLTSQWEQWMVSKPLHTTTIDERKRCAAFATPLERKHEDTPVEAWLQTTSRLSTAIRALAYALRWSTRQQAGIARFAHPLSADELRRAEKALIHAVQHEHFSEDTARLRDHLPMPRTSPLRRLLPYLDADGLICVGGRLQNAMLTEGEKHPLIVPANSRIVELLVRDAHLRTLHGGPQLVASFLLRRYWIIRSRNIIRKLVWQCVRI